MRAGVIYRGQSLIDQSPIIVVAVYSDRNPKTGEVLQTYILMEDINPLEASKTGADYGICGDCLMRGRPTTDPKRKQAEGRDCYVNLGHGPLVVWRGFHRGIYPMADSEADRNVLGHKRFVRIGTYGDPAAAPQEVWTQLLANADHWTAYSHQSGWRPDIAMQSVDNYPQAWSHWRAGRRTFRVVTGVESIDTAHEVLCPASKEAGRRVQCTACKLCKGSTQAKSIAIVQH